MKTFQCHKRVRAARILSVPVPLSGHIKSRIMLDGDVPHIIDSDWIERHKPVAGGYLVIYEDGYESFSPAVAFEAGYAMVAGVDALPSKVTRESLLTRILNAEYVLMPDGRTTVCQLTMANGFTVRGESSCIAVENFDKALGEKYAYEKAVDAAWAFEAYLLADTRHATSIATVAYALPPTADVISMRTQP